MDKKSIIGLVLIFLVFVGYMFWIRPSEEEIAERMRQDSVRRVELMRADSIANADAERQHVHDSLAQLTITDSSSVDSAAYRQKMTEGMGVFASNVSNPRINLSIKNNLMSTQLSSLGASVQNVVLSDYVTFDSMPLEIITPGVNNMDLNFADARYNPVYTRLIPFAVYCNGEKVDSETEYTLGEGDSVEISFRAYAQLADSLPVEKDSYLEYVYTFRYDSYEVDFDINFHNLKDYVNVTPNMNFIWSNSLRRQEQYDRSQKGRNANRNKDSERFYTSLYYKNVNDNPDNLRDGRDDTKQITTPLEWVAYKQQFFCAILMSENGFRNAQEISVSTDRGNKDDNYLCDMSSILGVDYDATADNFSLDMGFYFGPNKYRELRDMHRGFERILPLGWGFFLTQWVSRFAIIPVFNFLENFGWNYGIIIIILTLLLKIVISPLTWNSYKTGAVMRHLKPEMDAINKKFPKQEQAMQKQQAMSQLQRRAGINPMAGCLPMLLQLPIIYAMFRFYPASIELRQKGFLWCDDLSSYDSILNLPFNIPIYGDHISLFCLLMFAMQFLYTVYTMKQQQGQASMPGMKFMMYFMPFMMLFIFNSQSAALNIYYFFNLLLSMLQMFGIRAIMTEDKVRARMAKAESQMKNKPQKKSKFQQRLEEMQRMSEEMQKQQQKRK